MMKRTLIAATAVLTAAACADTPTASYGPIQTVVQKTPICHYEEETGLYWLINVPSGGTALQKHLGHGDGERGDAVPGRPGYAFDENCIPRVVERVFAIAYTDVDPHDGPGFKNGTDVLIAKLVDANNDGVVSAGDQVITNQYPTDFDATAFGRFGVTVHTVVWFHINDYPTHQQLLLDDGTGASLQFLKVYSPGEQVEAYAELTPGWVAVSLGLVDGWPTVHTTSVDRMVAEANAGPSRPDTTIPDARRYLTPGADDAFIDVEINLGGL